MNHFIERFEQDLISAGILITLIVAGLTIMWVYERWYQWRHKDEEHYTDY